MDHHSMSNNDADNSMMDEDADVATHKSWVKRRVSRKFKVPDMNVARAVVKIAKEPRKLVSRDYKKICVELQLQPNEKNGKRLRSRVQTQGVKFEIARLREIMDRESEQPNNSLPVESESEDMKPDTLELSNPEESAENDPSPNCITPEDWFDLSLAPQDYMRKISKPFALDLYTEKQVDLVRKEKTILHLSRSSTLIPWYKDRAFRTTIQSNPIHYYIGVIRTHNTDFPIFEFMTETPTPLAIQVFLSSYLAQVAQVDESYLEMNTHAFTSIVVDFNPSLLDGVLGALNWENLLQYTNRCFTDGHHDKTRVQVHVCFNDFMTCVSVTLKEHQVTPEVSSFVLNAFALMANARTLEEFESIFKGLVFVTCSEYINALVEAYEEPIRSYLRQEHVSQKPDSDNPSNEDFDQIDFYKSHYYRKYSKMFRALLEEIRKMDQTEMKNKMYCPGFMKVTLGLYMAYPNLWSMFAYRGSSDVLLTNDSAEWHIKEVRKEYFEKKTTNICTFIEQRNKKICRDILKIMEDEKR